MLVVDDDADTVAVVHAFLSARGFTVKGISRSDNYTRDISRARPRLLLLDVQLGNTNGIDAYKKAVASSPGWSPHVCLMTAVPPAKAETLARSCNATGVLAKPFDMDEMLALAERVLRPGA